jgi:hypothetical protein
MREEPGEGKRTRAMVSRATLTKPSVHQWLAVTITTAVVRRACPVANTPSQRGPVRATTTAMRAAHPMCRLGMAAYWLATWAADPA